MQRSNRSGRRTRRLAVAAVAAVAALAPTSAHAATTSMASLESGGSNEFSQMSATSGSLTPTTDKAYDGTHSLHASYDGSGNNGYARGIQNVTWGADDDVWYGGAYYLPQGYQASVKGGDDLLRWDNWGTYGSGADYGSLELWSDGQAHMVMGHYTGDGHELGQPFKLPEGRWAWIEVHSRFSATPGQALTEVYIDGRKVFSSTQPNTYGRPADRVRFGIVCIAMGKQTSPLSLWIDRLSVSDHQVGPLGSAPSAPAPAPAQPGLGQAPGKHHRHGRPHRRAEGSGRRRAKHRRAHARKHHAKRHHAKRRPTA